MNKYQVVWLIIRLAGVYFAYLTLIAFLGLVGSIPALFTLPKIDVDKKNANANVAVNRNPTYSVQPVSPNVNYNSAETGDANAAKSGDSITAKFRGENVTNFLWFLILTGFYGAAAWYLLRDGRILYGILNREEPHGLKTKEKEAEVTTLNLSDKQS